MLQTFALVSLVVVFFVGLGCTNSSNKSWKSFSLNAANYLTSIGIFFTFFGIFLALRQFDVNNINTAVPKLLDGLKLAFLSSVAGIGGSIVYRMARPVVAKASTSDNVSGSDLLEQLINLNQGTVAVKDALIGEGDSSLSTQMMKLRTDFRDFAEKVTEDGSNALIKALEEVMKDFNAKINEQFGDNFKQLNEAVKALLEWQKEHKKQVEALTEVFTETQKGIDTVRQNVQEIETSTSKIPDQMTKIEDVFSATDKRMSELYEGLGSLSSMREKAEEALPHIESQLVSLTEGLSKSINKQMDHVSDIFEDHAKKSADIQTNIENQLTSVTENLSKSIGEQMDYVSNIFENHAKKSSETQANLENQLTSMTESLRKSIGEQMNHVTDIFEEQAKKSAETQQKFTGVLDSFSLAADDLQTTAKDTSQQVKDIISDFKKQQGDLSRDLQATLQESINDIEKTLNQSVSSLDSSMQQTLQRSLDTLGNNLTAITKRFVEVYEPFAERVSNMMRRTGRDE